MSVRSQLPKWLFASVIKHFNTALSSYNLFIEGTQRETSTLSEWMEIRVDGPYYGEVSKNTLVINSDVNILVVVVPDSANLYRQQQLIGKVVEAFTDITLYKLGNDAEDTKASFGCYMLQPTISSGSKTKVRNFGIIDPNVNILQATVEGNYRLILDL